MNIKWYKKKKKWLSPECWSNDLYSKCYRLYGFNSSSYIQIFQPLPWVFYDLPIVPIMIDPRLSCSIIFFNSLLRFRYLCSIQSLLTFTLWLHGTVKSPLRQFSHFTIILLIDQFKTLKSLRKFCFRFYRIDSLVALWNNLIHLYDSQEITPSHLAIPIFVFFLIQLYCIRLLYAWQSQFAFHAVCICYCPVSCL